MRVTVRRVDASRPQGRTAAVAAALIAACVTAAPALAGSSAQVQATIPVQVPVKSVTVTPAAVTLNKCTDVAGTNAGASLVMPNGLCQSPTAIDVSNSSNTTEQITVSASAATPADNGTSWALCDPLTTANACTGTGAKPPNVAANYVSPGPDQYAESNGSLYLTPAAQCDSAFSSCTAISAGRQARETLGIEGPSSSTDSSSSFVSTVTWTAS